MTEARTLAKRIADTIQMTADRLPPGTVATIRSGWASASAGAFPVDVHIHAFEEGPALVEYTVTGRTKHAAYIAEHQEYYTSLNWSEADCIHLVKAGDDLVHGVDRLACEMMVG